jgi:hypothetical protein
MTALPDNDYKVSGWETSRFIAGRITPQNERLLKELARAIEEPEVYSYTLNPATIVVGLTGLAAIVQACAIAPSQPSFPIKPEAVVDLTETLKHNQSLYPKGSACPLVLNHKGIRQDFRAHLDDRPWGNAGVDFVGNKDTIIVAAEDGYVVLLDNNKMSGKTVVMFHGSGYITKYAHLDEYLVSEHQYRKRGQPLGRGGDNSSDIKISIGTHLTLLGPDYSPLINPFVTNRNLQDTGNKSYFNLWRYPIDSELFSPLAGCLPYYRIDIQDKLGKPLIERAKEAQNMVYQMLDQLKRDKLTPSEKEELDNLFERDSYANRYWSKGLDIFLDRKMSFVYRQINKDNPPFENPNVVSNELIGLMKTMVPVLTAPIQK